MDSHFPKNETPDSQPPGSYLRAAEPRPIADVTDGTHATLMLVDVAHRQAVPWMSPLDADETLLLELGAQSDLPHVNGFLGAFVDGSVKLVPKDSSAAVLRSLHSIAGGD